jgi:hypothetical protein
MSGQVDPERRLRCLSLGTYALAVVERLYQAPGGRAQDLPALIDDTLSAVEAIRKSGWAASSASGLRPYRYDDQLDILSAVHEIREVPREPLLRVKSHPNTADKQDLQAAIRFFHELAREALRQSHFSVEETVAGFRS